MISPIMLFLVRLVMNVVLFLVVDFPVMLLGMVVLAVVLPFIPEDKETLPKCLAWFDNYSGRLKRYPLGDGLSGDPLYRHLRRDAGHTNLFWERYYWLALRNPANYFSYAVLGHTYTSKAKVLSIKGPMNPELVGGFKRLEAVDFEDQIVVVPFDGIHTIVDHPISLYEYYYAKYYTLFGRRFYIRFRMGYKVGNDGEIASGETVERVFSFNPLQPARGSV